MNRWYRATNLTIQVAAIVLILLQMYKSDYYQQAAEFAEESWTEAVESCIAIYRHDRLNDRLGNQSFRLCTDGEIWSPRPDGTCWMQDKPSNERLLQKATQEGREQ